MRTRASWQGLLLRVLATLCLSSQLAGALHFALVRHGRCAAHGELVHATARGERGSSPTRHALHNRSYEAETPASGEHAQHEHCAACAERRLHVALAHPSVSAVAEPARPTAANDEDARDPLARERWLLAPKSSPPA